MKMGEDIYVDVSLKDVPKTLLDSREIEKTS